MAAPSPGPQDRLDSWKEIAAYLKRGVRTVQRWERTHGLPVSRLKHDRLGSVYAYRADLDAWWERRGRQLDTPADVEIETPPESARPKWKLILLGGVSLAVLLSIGYLSKGRTSADIEFKPLDPTPLTSDLGDERWPTFSPDGNQVAYAWNGPSRVNYDIYVKMIGSEAPLRLTKAPDQKGFPAWSPDGRQIAFLRAQAQGRTVQLIVIPAIGGSERVITELGPCAGALAWSADGRWIVALDCHQHPTSLFAISVLTGDKRRLTTAPSENCADFDPAIAPDGSSLVFARDLGSTNELYRLRLSPQFTPVGEPERLTNGDTFSHMPVFTADGSAVVYSAGLFEESQALWLLPLSNPSRVPRLLLRTTDQLHSPAISRRRNRLVFSAQRGESNSTWKLDLTSDFRPSGKPVRLISSTHTDYNAQYSPDGRRIVFHSTRTGTSEIWLSDSSGKDAVRLTNFNAPITGSPRWSPDGKWIVFDSNTGGHFNVYRVGSGGGNPQQLTHSSGTDGVPGFSHDGRSVYFVSDRSGAYQIWKMSADGSNPRQITRKGGYLALESSDRHWIYYCRRPGVSPLMRVPAEGGEETEVLPAVGEFNFCLTPKGVLFARSARLIEFLSFDTGRIIPFARLDRPLKIGLAVSTDQRHLLFSQPEEQTDRGSDLMLVENFQPFR